MKKILSIAAILELGMILTACHNNNQQTSNKKSSQTVSSTLKASSLKASASSMNANSSIYNSSSLDASSSESFNSQKEENNTATTTATTKTNNSNSPVTKQTQSETTTQSYSNDAIAMAAYDASYDQYYGNGNHVHGSAVYMSQNNGQYIIGQGTADSTATITINGNNVTTSFPVIKDVKAVSYDTQTFNINQLMNQQYQTTTQKNYINSMISDGYNNMNQLNKVPHPQN